MVGRRKKCCKCGKTVCYLVPNEGGSRRTETVIPFKLFKGKYWCNDCFNRRDIEEEPDMIGMAPNYDKFEGWDVEEVLVFLNID